MSHPLHFNLQDPSLSFSNTLCRTFLAGCAGAAAAAIFTTVSPLGGAVFAASGFLSHRLVTWVCESLNCCPDTLLAKVATFVLAGIGAIGAAMAATAAFGIQLTLAAAVVLTIATVATAAAATLVFVGCFCAAAMVTGVALGSDGGVIIRG